MEQTQTDENKEISVGTSAAVAEKAQLDLKKRPSRPISVLQRLNDTLLEMRVLAQRATNPNIAPAERQGMEARFQSLAVQAEQLRQLTNN